MIRRAPLLLTLLALAAAPAAAAARPAPASCPAKLQVALEDKAVAEVKLEDEYERSDAQAYLIRLELAITKQRLAAALAKCGAACAPAAPPAAAAPPRG